MTPKCLKYFTSLAPFKSIVNSHGHNTQYTVHSIQYISMQYTVQSTSVCSTQYRVHQYAVHITQYIRAQYINAQHRAQYTSTNQNHKTQFDSKDKK